jgi:predicted AAA+ superfamily ATPase
MLLIKRQIEKLSGSFFLFGPRGTGKTMWLHDAFPHAYFVDLLDPSVFMTLSASPNRLRDIVEGNAGKTVFVIDEVQKVPALLDIVHQLIEEYRDLSFVLTGSSARKLKRAGADLLASRAFLMSMHPFTASELKDSFSLERALEIGMVPVVNGSQDPVRALSTYIDLYLREEIQQEGLVRNLGPFSRFMEAVSFSHGSQMTISAVARECGVPRTTVEGYINILRDLLLCSMVPVFSKRAKRELVKHEKFYFFDAGVFRTIRPKGPLDRPAEIDGAALEGLVFQNLRAWLDYSGERSGLYFWRTQSGREVDFVVYTENEFVAIEVKNAAKLTNEDFSGLKAFKEDYPESRSVLLYRGKEQYLAGDVLVMPVDAFLVNMVPNAPLPDKGSRR